MSEQNIPQNMQQSTDSELMGGAGFESEAPEQNTSEKKATLQAKPRKSDEMKRNFMAVFGHGPGKFALISVLTVVVIGLAFGYRGLTEKKEVAANKAKMDMPNAPAPEVGVGPVSDREAARRAEAASHEAEKAAAQGKTYQPGFDPNIVAAQGSATGSPAQFNVAGAPPSPQGGTAQQQPINPTGSVTAPQQPVQITVPAGQATASTTGSAANPQRQSQNNNGQQQSQSEQQAATRRDQEYQAAKTERDKYVNVMREQVLKQVSGLLGEGQQQAQGGLNAVGAYSAVSYYPSASIGANAQGSAGVKTGITPVIPEKTKTADGLSIGDSKGKRLIKTGNMMYATLDSEVNTDDGGEVLATIRGGKWDNAKLIGRIEQSPNNIRLKFSILAPQDDRQTMRISAVALREEDAKQGVAETIDHHTLSRYTSLAAASLMAGIGRAYSTPTGTTIISNGQVITTTEEPTTKRIVGSAIGEMGTAISGEVRRGFNRPSTYATPAQHGFGLFFLQDVYDQSN